MDVSENLTCPVNATTDLPKGLMAAIVTSLEMTAAPLLRPDPDTAAGLSLERLKGGDIARYLAMYRRLGHRWMWFSRLVMSQDAVASIIGHHDVEAYCLVHDGKDIGLLELDFREENACELGFFGLVDDVIGQGAGRWLMNRAIALAWAKPISRFWVHTCTFDSPGAPDFYQRSGFRIFQVGIEIAADPRLSGHLPRDAAPQVPLIAP